MLLQSLYFSRFLPNRPRPLSSFDTHARWRPVTQSARSRRSYGKIEDCEQSTIFRASQPGENPLRISIDICTLKEPLRFQALSRLGISLANPDVFPVVASEKRDEAGGHSCRALPTVTGRKR